MQISTFAALLVSTIYIVLFLCFDRQFFHGWWGSERSIDMEFSLEAFKQAPSREALELCRKTDLYLIADFYDISVTKTARKQEVRDEIDAALTQHGILQLSPNVGVGLNAVASDDATTSGSDPMLHSLRGVNSEDLKLAIQLKQLDLEIKRQEHTTQLLRFRQCELETQADWRATGSVGAQMVQPPSLNMSTDSHLSSVPQVFGPSDSAADFDISRHLTLVPVFRDNEVESYLGAFERIAVALRWPKEVWSLLIQCKLTGKAQKICSMLSVADTLD